MLTEREAWLYLSRAWLPCSRIPSKSDAIIGKFGSEGLCNSIWSLWLQKMISEETYLDMCKWLYKYREEYQRRYGRLPQGYFWPRNGLGAQQRVEFCLKIVGRL